MPRVFAMAVALVAVTGGGSVEPAAAYTAKGVGVVSALRGEVSVTHAPGVAARESRPAQEALRFRDDVFFQDVIDTQRESTAKVLLKGRATLTIRELSRVELREGVVPGEPSRTRSIMGLLVGAFRAVVQRDLRPQDELEIRTPNAVAAVRGTDVVVEVYQDAAPPPLPAAALEPTLQPVSSTIAQAPGGTGATTRVFVREGELVMDGVRAAALQGLEKVGNLPPRRFQFTPDFMGRLVGRFAIAAVRAPQGAPQAQVTAALRAEALGHAGRAAPSPAFHLGFPGRIGPSQIERAVHSLTASTGRDLVFDGPVSGSGTLGVGGLFQFTDATFTPTSGSRFFLSFTGLEQPPSGPPGTFDFRGILTGRVRLLSGAPGGANLRFSSNGFSVTLRGLLALVGQRFQGQVFGTYACPLCPVSSSGTVGGTIR